jgi:uncharacterized protein (DUF362 family)
MDDRVFVADCKDYDIENVAAAVDRILDAYGGAKAIMDISANGGRRVLVKPNILIPKRPEDAATTHPAVIAAVCSAFIKAGAEVSIIDSTGAPHTKMLLRLLYGITGIKKAAKQCGAKLSFDTSSRPVLCFKGRIMEQVDLLSPVLDADLVISLAKAKTHGFMTLTGCVKNMFGCVPGMGKPRLHKKFPKREDFAAMLIDVCLSVNPGFSILDAVYGMEGAGPAGGDPKHVGALLGGFSPYAVDLAQCNLMGMRTDSICTIQESISRDLIPDNPKKLTWLGDDPEQFRKSFKPATKNKNDNIPKIMNNCIGCGDCARVCPMQCIVIRNRLAVIDEKECIKCYCCHEFCPVKAINLD